MPNMDSPEEDAAARFQNTVWWITSIAISVVCCSVLFILFASYVAEIKNDIRETSLRINSIEQREDAILTDVEIMNKRAISLQAGSGSQVPMPPSVPQPQPAMPPIAPAAPPPDAPQSAPPEVSQPASPSPAAVSPETAPVSGAPAVTVPVLPAPPEKQ
jgi:hypothetical protein